MTRGRFSTKAEIVLRGHILNWPWRSRLERRRARGAATRDAVCAYLDRYVSEFLGMPYTPAADAGQSAAVQPAPARSGQTVPGSPMQLVSDGSVQTTTDNLGQAAPGSPVQQPVPGDSGKERIFSIWLQGEQSAPDIVKACWRSVRANSSRELVVLDSGSLGDWIELPPHVTDKWRRGLIKPAHFTDICRVALLYRYGGYWMDATDFLPAELPEWIDERDFFVYMSGERLRGWYAYIQNCFIRARKGNYLLALWLNAMLVYWSHEDSAIDYFVHQLLFRKAVGSDPRAAELFAAMPKIVQDPTHELWFGNASKPFDPELFRSLTAAAAFQKTEYRSSDAVSPRPGSFADAMMKMYL